MVPQHSAHASLAPVHPPLAAGPHRVRLPRLALVLLLATAAVPALAERAVEVQKLVGSWSYQEGASLFETFDLALAPDQGVFRSWLHDRPDSQGSWSLAGRILTIRLDWGSTVTWQVVSVSDSRLVVRDQRDGTKAVFRSQPPRERAPGSPSR